ncbi:capsular polysaccharide biosynthesis protein [Bordetella trematum]|uniref:capsule biosynthesis protein n=1 Tax=Bordetella trematum TaxID=123899 RepID=UPI000796C632|nr:capsular biosynthesis protein [Bordetella trematum]SAI59114.1 capsular polysaccharide biosynthesis protein [Bordetella trematum]
MTQKQRFLFLQGVCSPFFPRLGQALRQTGHVVRKVNFTVGDRMYWRIGQADAYRGPMDGLDDFYRRQYDSHGITDIVLFGDCRPVHRPAIARAQAQGIRVHVFEEGYFRPYWVTLERDGVNGNSRLPRDPDWYHNESHGLYDYGNGNAFQSPFWKRAAFDVGYNFWAGLNPILHPGVQSHVPYSPLTEYLGYAGRGLRVKWSARSSRAVEKQLIYESPDNPFYLLPLQLATDSQITHHSPFSDMLEATHFTMRSFARFAPENSRLALKIHPLDPGLVNYAMQIKLWAQAYEIPDRVFYLESGNLPALLSHTAGVVTVNSTVGASALIHTRPTIALGKAIYGIPGLTFQGELDDFWVRHSRPDAALYRAFRNVVIDRTQLNGGFYSSDAIQMSVTAALPKLLKS